MRIQQITWYCVAQERRDGGGNQRYIAAIALDSDDGCRGGAVLHVRKPPAPEATARAGDILTGMQIEGPEQGWDALHEAGAELELLSLCDIALWDLWARSRQSSVCDLLGRKRDRIPAYLSTAFNVGTPEEYVELAQRCKSRGY